MHVDTTVVFSQFLGALPTLVAVLLAWMQNNTRIGDTHRRIDDVRDLIKAEATTIRAELRRVEEVMDARLKHLEEQ